MECCRVSFAYPQRPPVLENISLTLALGSYTWLRGPSGSGKSTFLRLLCRLLEPTGGRVTFNGQPISEIDPPALRRQVVYLHQTPVVLDASVRENLLLPFTFKLNQHLGLPEEQDLSRRLQEFRLQGVALDTRAASLSVGQKQRLCLLRAMLLGPTVLLLDEPVAALDEESAGAVLDTVQRLHQEQGVTVVMVAHGSELWGRPGINILEVRGTDIVPAENFQP